MPLYEYRCADCAQLTEVRHGFNDSFTEPCPQCGGALRRVFNPAPIVFKGAGFYVTDSRKKTQEAASSQKTEKPAKPDSDGSGKPDAAPAKSDSKESAA